MTKKALVLFANGFEEIEAAAPVDILRRAGVEVTTASVGVPGREVVGARDMVFRVDTVIEKVAAGVQNLEFDLLVLPGGMPGAKHLGESSLARAFAERMLSGGKIVAAICAAPVKTLAAWGLLDGRRATCYPGLESHFPPGVSFSIDRVVDDGNIVTSRGPGTACEFALALAARLAGQDRADEVRAAMLVK